MLKEFFWLLTHFFRLTLVTLNVLLHTQMLPTGQWLHLHFFFFGGGGVFGNKILVLVSNLTFTDHGYRVCYCRSV